jgi:hypothetical protein
MRAKARAFFPPHHRSRKGQASGQFALPAIGFLQKRVDFEMAHLGHGMVLLPWTWDGTRDGEQDSGEPMGALLLGAHRWMPPRMPILRDFQRRFAYSEGGGIPHLGEEERLLSFSW